MGGVKRPSRERGLRPTSDEARDAPAACFDGSAACTTALNLIRSGPKYYLLGGPHRAAAHRLASPLFQGSTIDILLASLSQSPNMFVFSAFGWYSNSCVLS